MEQKREEELNMLTFASNMNKSLIRIVIILLAVNVAIVVAFLLFIHFTSFETTTLTTEAGVTDVNIQNDNSTITTYPNTSTNRAGTNQ